ncbi:actin-like ATPase involved in cell morphogenesis [Microbacterium ginsengiterrae]|uniref:Actin-like ATPase involved in cell morphogenesis n=1 Tax=Microbacterium ginsengiterrae TaxID=546115 RepID=A0A7W9FDF3_9MICO|nr:actin-like ATPase involved in cell morphogenesis [Microbacterium ginsengiterrae]
MRDVPFALAIDVGSSRVTAAVVHIAREAYDDPTLFSLGASGHSAPSAAFVDEQGGLLFGVDAEQRGILEPHRLTREFAHDVGTDTPVVVGARAVSPDDLVARMCAWIADEVTTAMGDRPDRVAVTHPASWGGHRIERLGAALSRAGIGEAILVSEPAAAAAQLEASHPVDAGRLVAMYDLGGTRFDARVLRRRRSSGRYQPVGELVRIDQLGGANFDDALLRHVLGTGPMVVDDATRKALARARHDVVAAKELLSSAGDATVHLTMPTGEASVRITRSEFEAMIDADLERTVEALDLAIESATGGVDHVEAIMLTGGSSRIPLVAQRLSQRFDLPIVAEADPQSTVALGAARIVGEQMREDASAAPSTALATIAATEKAPAPRPQAEPERGRVLAFLRPVLAGKSRSTSPVLLAGAAAFIAITIVFSSTTAAGTRWPDYVQEAAAALLHLPMASSTSGPSAQSGPADGPPQAVPVSEQQPQSRTDRTTAKSETRSTAAPARKSNRPQADSSSTSSTSSKPSKSSGLKSSPGAPSSGSKPTPGSPNDGGSSGTTNPPASGNPPADPGTQEGTPGGSTPDTPPVTTDPGPSQPETPADPEPTPVDPPPADPTPVDPTPVDPAPEQPAEDPAPYVETPPTPEATPGPAPEAV